MIKYIIVLILGIIETYIYTWYLISVEKRETIKSTILTLIYMIFYLGIIAWAIKDTNTIPMILTYAVACAIGNFLRIRQEIK